MSAYLVLAAYLLDPMVSALLPVSSGLFAVFLVIFLWARAAPRQALPRGMPLRIAAVFAGLGLCGLAGAVLSGTPVTPLFIGTVVLLYLLWSRGARWQPGRRLLRPSVAMVGVVLAHLALIPNLFGFDLFELLRGVPSNRAAGLFAEPSHFGLYVTPLWLLAYSRPRYRPLLIVLLLLSAGLVFSLTNLLFLAIAAAVVLALRVRSLRHAAVSFGVFAAVVAALTAALVTWGDAVEIDGMPLSNYVSERVVQLFVDPEESEIGISSLAVLQGVDIARGSVTASLGLGVGLGNLGINEAINSGSLYRELMFRATGSEQDLNLRDGGLLLNKLIGEMGIFAVLVLVLTIGQFRRVRALEPAAARHYHTALLALLVTQLFVRGLPYFSAPSCLMIVSLASLAHAGAARAATGRAVRRARRRHSAAAGAEGLRRPSEGAPPATLPTPGGAPA